VGFIQLPTTLLAHDSSVGGKTAVNHSLGKNMIGAFYQPDAVVYDTETLMTLPEKEWRSGFAEVVKHSLIRDKSLYDLLRNEITSKDDLEAFPYETILKRAISVKAEIVSEDEKEAGVRAHLNFGHTLAHALEAEMGYGKITHGEAVAIGMLFAMRLSERYFDIQLPVDQLRDWLKELGYETAVPKWLSPEALLERMKHDKKTVQNQIRFVLMKEIGNVEMVNVKDEWILQNFSD
ncbi:MAG TPA: 3-dehydroquinate synthase family protein, partial [Bacillales bacterium]|nr:3-dehydroquinate synthase family protein [Bacillales bacterium]